MNNTVEKFGYTIDETCFAIGFGRTKCYEEIAAGRLRLAKIGGRSIVTNVKEYVEERIREAAHAKAS